jgi:hypothetical protein
LGGDTLVVRTTHVKTAWIRRGVGIPGSDRSEFTAMITRHDNLLTITTIQDDPIYLTEPHVVSRVWEFDPNGSPGRNNREHVQRRQRASRARGYGQGAALSSRTESGRRLMVKHYNIPKDAAPGLRVYPVSEYRKMLRGSYKPPTSCDRYCCGWTSSGRDCLAQPRGSRATTAICRARCGMP